jgi:hypothetical protein
LEFHSEDVMTPKARSAFGRCSSLRERKEFVVLLVMAAAAASCAGEDGSSAKCPEIPLYDVKSDAALDPAVIEARNAAAAAECLTLEGDATTPPDAGPSDPD